MRALSSVLKYLHLLPLTTGPICNRQIAERARVQQHCSEAAISLRPPAASAASTPARRAMHRRDEGTGVFYEQCQYQSFFLLLLLLLCSFGAFGFCFLSPVTDDMLGKLQWRRKQPGQSCAPIVPDRTLRVATSGLTVLSVPWRTCTLGRRCDRACGDP